MRRCFIALEDGTVRIVRIVRIAFWRFSSCFTDRTALLLVMRSVGQVNMPITLLFLVSQQPNQPIAFPDRHLFASSHRTTLSRALDSVYFRFFLVLIQRHRVIMCVLIVR